jgi:5'-3' exonuclease
MGIPSYFSQVVRRHKEIIERFIKNNRHVDNLYLDSNSIIYDAIRVVERHDDIDFEERLIQAVCDKVEFYIRKICPTQRVMIAFDGVAPMAKLKQQRTRRYKTWLTQEILRRSTSVAGTRGHPVSPGNTSQGHPGQEHSDKSAPATTFNTSAITPGTSFMDKLSKAVHLRFSASTSIAKSYGVKQIIVTTSTEVGEGEHKIFEYIRANAEYHKETSTIIYGLDADLIMLSLTHIHLCKNIYLHRETPEFIKNIDTSLEADIDYLFCISTLHKRIEEDMPSLTYVFKCFLLGNDFLPHFPALNIRTNGLDKLQTDARDDFFTKKGIQNINVSGARAWVDALAKNEHEYIKDEYNKRSKMRFMKVNNEAAPSDKEICENILLQYPLRDRRVEEYINPNEPGWEYRYYKILFDIEINDARRKEISINYLEGLEWTLKYYTTGCPDWTWYYKYNYPPLLCDLIKYMPYFDTTFINDKRVTKAVSPYVQLAYVLPRSSMYLLPDVLHRALLKSHPEWYLSAEYPLEWAFTRYIWEAHVKLPEIDIKELTKTVENCVIVK